MRFDMFAVRSFGLILVVPLCFSAVGCSSLYRDDLAPRSSAAASTVSTTGAVDIRPAVLVQDGSAPGIVASGTPTKTANVDKLPPLPKGDVAPSDPTKLLTADEKARVIAELEALARDPAGTPAKTDCKVASTSKPGVVTTAAAATSCNASAKPVLRP